MQNEFRHRRFIQQHHNHCRYCSASSPPSVQREPNEKRVDSYPKIMAVERVVRLAEVRRGGEGEVKD